MKNEHTITVIVTDQNDSPSTPRSVHVMVYSFNEKTPVGKIADVHPNDLDTTGAYSCKILHGSSSRVLTIPIACDLHTNKITSGIGYSLNVSGNDGRHPDVISKVTVEFLVFTNATIENSVTLKISKLAAKDFLSQHYRALLDLLHEKIDVDDTLTIFSIGEDGPDLNVHVAVRSSQGYRTKYEVTDLLTRNRDQIRILLEDNSFTISYSPCKHAPCENGGSCSDRLAIYDDARITDSQALILTSPRMLHEMICKCRDGFTGDRCEKRQDPCSPNPCLLVSRSRDL